MILTKFNKKIDFLNYLKELKIILLKKQTNEEIKSIIYLKGYEKRVKN